MNADLAEYHVPVNADVPSLEAILFPEEDAYVNPLGVKGVGEIGSWGTVGLSPMRLHATGSRVAGSQSASRISCRGRPNRRFERERFDAGGHRPFDPHRRRVTRARLCDGGGSSPGGVGPCWARFAPQNRAARPRAERPKSVEIETLDMTDHDQMLALRDRLTGRRFDVVFVNAGIVNRTPSDTMAGVSTDEFVRVMVTNVLGVMRAVEAFGPSADRAA